MSLSASRTRLEMLTKDILLKWEETRNSWRDSKSLEFEHQYIQELSARVDKSATMIDKLDELLTKVRHDCE
jgi:hypothetical protein